MMMMLFTYWCLSRRRILERQVSGTKKLTKIIFNKETKDLATVLGDMMYVYFIGPIVCNIRLSGNRLKRRGVDSPKQSPFYSDSAQLYNIEEENTFNHYVTFS